VGGLFRLYGSVFQRLTLFGNLEKLVDNEYVQDGKNDDWSNPEEYFTDH